MKSSRILMLASLLPALAATALAQVPAFYTNMAPVHLPLALPHRTSIVLVVCHGLGYGDLSCYGQTNFQTPNLDALAAQGVRCTEYYAGNAEGASARVALLIGRKNVAAPATNDTDLPLNAADLTIGQRLQATGYHTGFIGEWGLGLDPWAKGFNEFAGFLSAAEGRNYYPESIWRYAPGIIHDRTNHVFRDYNGPAEIHQNSGHHREIYFPDRAVSMAVKFIKNNQPDAFNRYRPFFLMLNLSAPRSATRGADDYPVPTDAPYSDESWPAAARKRAAMIVRLDSSIGVLLKQINDPAFSNHVAIFFTSDAGPEKFANPALNFLQPAGKLRGQRGDLHEGGLRVPMIARWPGQIPPGQTSDQPWAAWDFAATALDLALLPAPVGDGISALPWLKGVAATNRDETFSWTLTGDEPVRAARLGNWKVIQTGQQPPEMYDLSVDPQEQTNTPNAKIAAWFAALPQ